MSAFSYDSLASAPTFEELAREEPALDALLQEARHLRATGAAQGDRLHDVWIGSYRRPGLKSRVKELVGWYRPAHHPLLSSTRTYSTVYDTIIRALVGEH